MRVRSASVPFSPAKLYSPLSWSPAWGKTPLDLAGRGPSLKGVGRSVRSGSTLREQILYSGYSHVCSLDSYRVRLDVFAEVVAAHKALVADRAGEAFFSRVRAQMALQLVRPRESGVREGQFSGYEETCATCSSECSHMLSNRG